MTFNGVMAVILRYFTEFVYDVVVKKFTFAGFAISSADEFLLLLLLDITHSVWLLVMLTTILPHMVWP